jgi:hypothetical protein
VGAGPPPSWGGERRSLTARDTRLCRAHSVCAGKSP